MKSATNLQRPDAFSILPAEEDRGAVQINDFIWMSPSNSNSYMLLAGEGRIIVNTGMGYEAPIHKAAFDAISTAPTSFIILTQGHVDHVGGVQHFREPGATVVAQRNNRHCQRDDERIFGIRSRRSFIFFKEAITRALKAMQKQQDGGNAVIQDRPVPDLTFDDSLQLQLGDLQLELYAVPGGETVDSLIIWLPQHKIVFTGNQFGPLFPHFPNFYTIRGDRYRFAEPYIESLQRVLDLEPELMITGHYEPIAGADVIRAELTRLRDSVQWVHERTLAGLEAGKDCFELMREIKLPPELAVGEGYGRVSWAVRAIYESYLGWFRLRSTTELYAEPPETVYAELAEAAGSEALNRRARAQLDQGNPLAAIHLAEIIRSAEPHDRQARETMAEAHRLLLQRSGRENFWEVRWLEHQLEQLQQEEQSNSTG